MTGHELRPGAVQITMMCECGLFASVHLVGVGWCCDSEICAMDKILSRAIKPTEIRRDSPHITADVLSIRQQVVNG